MGQVSIELVGGLGNQLFGYYAGRYVSSSLNRDLLLDFSNVMHYQDISNDTIMAFDLSNSTPVFRGPDTSIKRIRRKVLDKTLLEFPRLSNGLLRLNQLVIDEGQTGEFDGKLLRKTALQKRPKLRGYFSNFEYFLNLKKEDQILTLRKHTDQLNEILNRAVSTSPISLHLRRGDYVGNSSTYGLLSTDYYRNCIRILMDNGINQPIWIFSDDSDAARDLQNHLKQFETVFVNDIGNFTAPEQLIIQTKCSYHVIANSTFSQWGSMLSESKLTLCPKAYFKDGRVHNSYPPKFWTEVESLWV